MKSYIVWMFHWKWKMSIYVLSQYAIMNNEQWFYKGRLKIPSWSLAQTSLSSSAFKELHWNYHNYTLNKISSNNDTSTFMKIHSKRFNASKQYIYIGETLKMIDIIVLIIKFSMLYNFCPFCNFYFIFFCYLWLQITVKCVGVYIYKSDLYTRNCLFLPS